MLAAEVILAVDEPRVVEPVGVDVLPAVSRAVLPPLQRCLSSMISGAAHDLDGTVFNDRLLDAKGSYNWRVKARAWDCSWARSSERAPV